MADPPSPSPDDNDEDKHKIWIDVLAALAGLLLVAIIFFTMKYCRRGKKADASNVADEDQPIDDGDKQDYDADENPNQVKENAYALGLTQSNYST